MSYIIRHTYHISHVICHMSHVMYHIICHISHLTSHIIYNIYRASYIFYHILNIVYYILYIMCHMLYNIYTIHHILHIYVYVYILQCVKRLFHCTVFSVCLNKLHLLDAIDMRLNISLSAHLLTLFPLL